MRWYLGDVVLGFVLPKVCVVAGVEMTGARNETHDNWVRAWANACFEVEFG